MVLQCSSNVNECYIPYHSLSTYKHCRLCSWILSNGRVRAHPLWLALAITMSTCHTHLPQTSRAIVRLHTRFQRGSMRTGPDTSGMTPSGLPCPSHLVPPNRVFRAVCGNPVQRDGSLQTRGRPVWSRFRGKSCVCMSDSRCCVKYQW